MKVIIATDGSDFSRTAIARFCQIVAAPEKAEIKIVSVYEKPVPMVAEPFAVSAEYYAEIASDLEKNCLQYERDAADQIRQCLPNATIQINTQTMQGAPGKAIVEAAQDWGADLIVTGSHGRGFWSRALLGSVSSAVMLHAPCSVLVVRQPENFNGHQKQPSAKD